MVRSTWGAVWRKMNWDIRARIEKPGSSGRKPQRFGGPSTTTSVLCSALNAKVAKVLHHSADEPLEPPTLLCIQVWSFWSAHKSMLQIIKSCKAIAGVCLCGKRERERAREGDEETGNTRSFSLAARQVQCRLKVLVSLPSSLILSNRYLYS